jgi:hypothetical protein
LSWEGPEPSDEEKQLIFDSLADSISQRMLTLATEKIRDEPIQKWQSAYNERGRGSTFVRAHIIGEQIYDSAVPTPDLTPSLNRNKFLRDVAGEVQQAAEEIGAKLV